MCGTHYFTTYEQKTKYIRPFSQALFKVYFNSPHGKFFYAKLLINRAIYGLFLRSPRRNRYTR